MRECCATDPEARPTLEEVLQRRYSEFAWLYLQLCQSHPGHLIPAFPPKVTVPATADLSDRMERLQLFLMRAVGHRVLQRNPSLTIFLQNG